MLPLSLKSRSPTAFFSLRYRQTTAQLHFNSFNGCKCLKQIFATNRYSETPNQTPNASGRQNYLKLDSVVFRAASF